MEILRHSGSDGGRRGGARGSHWTDLCQTLRHISSYSQSWTSHLGKMTAREGKCTFYFDSDESHLAKRLINKMWENPSLQKRYDSGRREYANYTNKCCTQSEYSHIVQYVLCLLCQGKGWGSLNWSLKATIDVCAIIWLLTNTKPQREADLGHLFALDVNVLY